jgi:signal transduction histidine kinase
MQAPRIPTLDTPPGDGAEPSERGSKVAQAVVTCFETLIQATEENGLLDAICRILVEEGGFEKVWVSSLDDTEVPTTLSIPVVVDGGSPKAINLDRGVDLDDLEVALLRAVVASTSDRIVALRAESGRAATEAQLRESLRAKDELIASIFHEMRTPLTAVVGFAQLLQNEESGLSSDERTELIQSIADEGLDLTNLVEDLLTAAKAESGTLTVVSVPVDLRANAAQVLETLNGDRPIELAGPSVRVAGDPGRVRQILRNLISNAIRYGGERIRVVVVDGQSPSIQVRDNGVGIPEEERERVFDPYQRASSAPELSASMGLGLTISRSLARLMGGDLTYVFEDSESIFELTLPSLLG